MVELKWYKVSSIAFENRVANGTQLKLKNAVKYNVNYMDDDNRCVGRLDFRVSDEDMNPFEIRVELEALFTYAPEDERPDIHTESFDQIFPFLRQIIHSTTAMSGMPGLMIPLMKLDRGSVNIGKPKEPGETSPLN